MQWFQDGTTSHTANITMKWLEHQFPNRLMSWRCGPEWSLHSPNQNPQIFITGVLEGQNAWEQSTIHWWPSIRRFMPYRKKSKSGWLTTSVSSAQWLSFGTRSVKKCILWARDFKTTFFYCYYINFQDM